MAMAQQASAENQQRSDGWEARQRETTEELKQARTELEQNRLPTGRVWSASWRTTEGGQSGGG